MSTSISRDGAPLPPHIPTPPEGGVKFGAFLPPDVWEHRAQMVVALKHVGMSQKEIAETMGVTRSTVLQWQKRARAEGRLGEDIHRELDKDTVFRALEVLNEALDEGSLEAALAVMKGRGIFRNYSNNNHEGGHPTTAIQIVYTTPSGDPVPRLVDVATLPGQIVGTPRNDEGPGQ